VRHTAYAPPRAQLTLAAAGAVAGLAAFAAFTAGPAWAAGDADTTPAGAKLMRIVALGDSTTATAQDWTPQIEEVYADCLPAALDRHGIRAEVVNVGIGGTTTRDAVARLDHDVRRHHPDIVVVQFGINDSWIDADEGRTRPRLTRDEYRRNLKHIIRTLELDGARIVLMTPNPMRWSDPHYIEAFERYDQVPGQSVNDLLLAGDGIHPSTAGQRLVCRLLTARIVELLAPPPAPPPIPSPP